MKIISSCERQFVENIIVKRQKRVDGRNFLEGRTLEVIFGKDRGSVFVVQGNTRTFAHVSCEVTEPKQSTPTEGVLHVNLEVSGMAAPDAKAQSRTSEEFAEAQRILERCIRDSKCIDLESLCIVTGAKVWTVRVDIHPINDDGNLIECASIAGMAALAHFRRPDITVVGTDVTMHSLDDREPVPLNLHHMPLSINLALFNQGASILVDPTEIEERVADGSYVIGMNAHQEICFVHRRGVLLLTEAVVQRCEDAAVKHAQEVTQIIRKALEDDQYKRATNAPIGLTNLIRTDTILGAKRPVAEFSFGSLKGQGQETVDVEDSDEQEVEQKDEPKIYEVKKSAARRRAMKVLDKAETIVFEGGPSKWLVPEDDRTVGSDEEDHMSEEAPESKPDLSQVKDEDSEEEIVYVNQDQVDIKPNTRGWYTKDPFL